MAFVPVPNTIEIVPQFLWDNQKCVNVYHVENASGWTVAEMEAMAADFVDWWTTEIQAPYAPNNLTLQSVIVRDLTTQTSPAIEYTGGLPLTGALANSLPNNVALAIKWTTALRGRSFRGRTYHMGLVEGHVTSNVVIDPHPSLLQQKYAALQTEFEDTFPGNEMVVVSRWENGVQRATGVTTPITGVTVERTVDSQRRRLPGRGQ